MNRLELILLRRPRVLNVLHRFYLASPLSQTNEEELAALARYATGRRKALEIGTHQGVSAAHIATAMSPQGVLYCVDPWPESNGRPNPCWLLAQRHFKRTKTFHKIKICRGLSTEVQGLMPTELDFAFIDGDHSWKGIEADWKIVPPRMVPGGIICLHDSVTPAGESWRKLDSTQFYHEVIAEDSAFKLLETVHSLSVLKKL